MILAVTLERVCGVCIMTGRFLAGMLHLDDSRRSCTIDTGHQIAVSWIIVQHV